MSVNSDDLLNQMGQGGFSYPAIAPPSGLPNLSGMPPSPTGFMGPNGLPLASQSLSTLMQMQANPYGMVNPPMLNPLQGRVNTGSATSPVVPQPPVNDQNQPTNSPTQPPSDSASGQDFLSTVRDTIGGLAHGVMDVLGVGAYTVARPAYEGYFHPESVLAAGQELAQMQAKGEPTNLKTPFDLITRKFEEENDPGIQKFIGEVLFDPTTYLGSGEVGLLAKGAGKIPLAGHLLEPALQAVAKPLELQERAFNRVGQVAGGTAIGIINNALPLYAAKDNAAKILGAFLPKDTVTGILDAVPNVYTGVPINWVADPVNARFPKLGLPDVLKVPEVRDIQVAKSSMLARDSIHSVLTANGINPVTYNPGEVNKLLWGIYSTPPDKLSYAERMVQDSMKRPAALGDRDFSLLGKTIGSSIESDPVKNLTLNKIVSDYRKGPSIADPIRGMDENEAVQAVQQLYGIKNNENPDSGYMISRWLQGKSDESRLLVQRLSESPDLVGEFGRRAATVQKGEWDLGIQVQRAHNTIWDQTLNSFDNGYTRYWKDGIQSYLQTPLSKMYLHFAAFMPWNVGETYVRSALYGGGLTVRRLDNQSFAIENALMPDTPPRLLELTPGEKRAVGQGAALENTRGKGPLTKLNPFDGYFERVNEKGNDLEAMVQRSFWITQTDAQADNIMFQRGLSARDDFTSYYASAKTPDVTQVPELEGLDQKLVDDVARQTIRTVNKPEAFNMSRANVDVGFINREKLASAIDHPALADADLYPSSKSIWYNGMRSATTPEEVDSVISRVIDNQKRYAQGAPEALAEKFQGTNQWMDDAGKRIGFTAEDMTNAYNRVHASYSQYSGIPELIRQMEYDEIERVSAQKGNAWRSTIHDQWNQRLEDSLKAVGSELDKSGETLNKLGNRFGVGPEMQQMTQLLKAEHELTNSTWADDLAFQKQYFARTSRGQMRNSAQTRADYYAGRSEIWAPYAGQRMLIREQQMAQDAIIRAKIAESAQAEALAKIQVARGLEGGISVEQIPPQAETIEPGIDSAVKHISDSIDNGSDPDHIASYDYDKVINDARSTGAESTVNVSSDTSGQAVSTTDPTNPIAAGSNGTSAAVIDADPSAIAKLYANADALRPRLTQHAMEVINNPAINDQHAKYLTSWMDNVKKEYESLSVDNQMVLTDVMKEASKRSRAIFDNAFVDYDGRNKFDWLMQHLFPFWMYESRRWPFLARTVIKRPALGSAYAAYMDQTNQGYIPLGELPFEINPLRGTVLGAVSGLTQADRPLKYTEGLQGALDSIDSTLAKFGLYLGPTFSIPSNIIRGAGGASSPPMLNLVLNAAHASPLPIVSPTAGTIEQTVLPSPFRDYYTRMIIASQGLEPDKIYTAAMDGESTDEGKNATAVLDAASKQADLVNIILQQTGVARFRTHELKEYQDARQQSIYEMTGISPQQQQDLQAQGKTLNQVSVLSPEQQSKLNAVAGTKEFSEISQPLLNPAAQKFRLAQRDFYDTLDKERASVTEAQTQDDRRLQNGIISGSEWRKRYQDRAGTLSTLFDDLRKAPPYDKIPISPEDQATARQRFNLPPYVDSPQSIALNEYYTVKPETDAVTGDVNWPKFYDDRQAVLQKYPFLQAELDRRVQEKDTTQVQQFKQDMATLRPYFGIKDAIVARMPQLGQAASDAQLMMNADPIQGRIYAQNNPQVKILNQLVSQTQKWARLHDPTMDAALVRWYGASPIQYQQLTSHKPATGLPSNVRL